VEIVLSRRGGVPLHDQLLAQLELQILSGAIRAGQRLPSVRALARRLGLHPNTVSTAYRHLEDAGHVELRRGAGVYVRAGTPGSIEDARGLDEMIRLALNAAFRKGYSGADVKAAVERWMRAAPPERVVVVDPRAETVALIAHEVRSALPVPVSGCTLEELRREPALLSGALAAALPYHAPKISRLAPGAGVVTVHVELSAADRRAVGALAAGSVVLVVSHSPHVLSFARALVGGLRGDELLVETHRLERRAQWRRLAPVADLVFADALALEPVRQAGPRRLRALRLLGETELRRIRKYLSVIVLGGIDGRPPGGEDPGAALQ
jgi:DNA-binding transcriptional regulator YhcF (GntR family)